MNPTKRPLEAGSNQMELLEFSIEELQGEGVVYRGLYGINVYKVRHVIPMPVITTVPLQAHCISGVFHFRGENIPLINLSRYLRVIESPTIQEKMVIIAEFNNIRVGFIVHGAHNIRRISWQDLRTPPEGQRDTIYKGITGIALINDNLVRVLDVEEVVAQVGLGTSAYDQKTLEQTIRQIESDHRPGSAGHPMTPSGERSNTRLVMVVDDSTLSRDTISRVLEGAGFSVITMKDGVEAWERIQVFLAEARRQGRPIEELLSLAVVDIEMPQMDGFSLTRLIKDEPDLRGLKVVLHTSLGGPENIYKGQKVGADEFVVKFNPKLLVEIARRLAR